jgi:hypothetical protein
MLEQLIYRGSYKLSYIGASPTTAAFPFDQFSGNGSTTAFTLSRAPASTTSIVVSISGVVQNPNTYSVSGLTLTFSPAPPTGTNNIGVLFLGLPVQVGTPTPGSTVQFALGSAANPSITFLGDTNTGIYSPGADTLAFVEGGTEAMRIDSSGNVGIGTSSPASRLDVLGTVGALTNATIRCTDSNMARLTLQNSNRTWTISNYGTQFSLNGSLNFADETAGVVRLTLDTSGALILAGSTAQKATGTTWSNPSDQRLKNNIRDYAKGTAELMQVRVREWEYNGKGGTTEGIKGLGVVADEVMEVLPNTVDNYEAKLNVDDEELTAIKKFDATEITWLLVKTVQELKAELDVCKAEIAALKGV